MLHVFLYEKAASKATSAEPPPRWAMGTGQLSCLQFRSGAGSGARWGRHNAMYDIEKTSKVNMTEMFALLLLEK